MHGSGNDETSSATTQRNDMEDSIGDVIGMVGDDNVYNYASDGTDAEERGVKDDKGHRDRVYLTCTSFCQTDFQ